MLMPTRKAVAETALAVLISAIHSFRAEAQDNQSGSEPGLVQTVLSVKEPLIKTASSKESSLNLLSETIMRGFCPDYAHSKSLQGGSGSFHHAFYLIAG